jgi:hypothetical protein
MAASNAFIEASLPSTVGRWWWRPVRQPTLTYCGFKQAPVVGVPNLMEIKSRDASAAFLAVHQDVAGVLFNGPVPPNSVVAITPSVPKEMWVKLILEPRQAGGTRIPPAVFELPVMPVANEPSFKTIAVPRQAWVGEELSFNWDAGPTAKAVDVSVDDGHRQSHCAGAASGVHTYCPARRGTLVVRFTVQGLHAARTETRTISVGARPPRITIDRPIQSGYPGSDVAFHWQIIDASKAYLEAPARELRREVEFDDAVATQIGENTEHFRLVAIGMDGRTKTAVTLSFFPDPLAGLHGPVG